MWTALERNLGPSSSGGLFLERFEPGIPVGVSDVYWLEGKLSGWIEMKFERMKLRPQQRGFLRRIAGAGGNAHIWAIDKGVSYLFSCKSLGVTNELPWDGLLIEEKYEEMNWNRFKEVIQSGK